MLQLITKHTTAKLNEEKRENIILSGAQTDMNKPGKVNIKPIFKDGLALSDFFPRTKMFDCRTFLTVN